MITQDHDSLVHLENGCICCDLNGAFVDEVIKLASEGNYDYLLVENTGVADPEPVAASIAAPSAAAGEKVKSLSGLVKLGTLLFLKPNKETR
jgi:G3E family GTPase